MRADDRGRVCRGLRAGCGRCCSRRTSAPSATTRTTRCSSKASSPAASTRSRGCCITACCTCWRSSTSRIRSTVRSSRRRSTSTPSAAAPREQAAIVEAVDASGRGDRPARTVRFTPSAASTTHGVFVLEVAARPIGGLCARALRFETRGRESFDGRDGDPDLARGAAAAACARRIAGRLATRSRSPRA